MTFEHGERRRIRESEQAIVARRDRKGSQAVKEFPIVDHESRGSIFHDPFRWPSGYAQQGPSRPCVDLLKLFKLDG